MSQARYSIDEWGRVFERQRSSGLSVLAFCRRERIASSSFFLWRRKLRGAVGFAEVKLAAEPAGVSEIELRLPDGRSLLVRPGFCRRTLCELLAALAAPGAEAAGSEHSAAARAAAR